MRNFLIISLLVLMTTLTGCVSKVATRGNMIDDDKLATIESGVSTKDDVMTALGSPSATGTFNDGTWYYIGQKTEQTAFLDPSVTDRKVVAIVFDENGVVQEVQKTDQFASNDVDPVGRKTRTRGREYGVLEQLFGNLGKYTPAGKK